MEKEKKKKKRKEEVTKRRVLFKFEKTFKGELRLEDMTEKGFLFWLFIIGTLVVTLGLVFAVLILKAMGIF